MNARTAHHPELLELLADDAAFGPDPAIDIELSRKFSTAAVGAATTEMRRAATVTQLAFLRHDLTAHQVMPADLRRKLQRYGDAFVRGRATEPVVSQATPRAAVHARPVHQADKARRRQVAAGSAGWLLAAALAVAFVIYRQPETMIAPDAARSALLAEAPDAVALPWAPPDAPGFEKVKGDVVWSQSRQQGYLRLAGMPVNDPARAQYQLWIVDPERDARPVDGGVFDITTSGEIIIPIQAKLDVVSPTAFAITREKPGGVVVSAGPLLVVASAG